MYIFLDDFDFFFPKNLDNSLLREGERKIISQGFLYIVSYHKVLIYCVIFCKYYIADLIKVFSFISTNL